MACGVVPAYWEFVILFSVSLYISCDASSKDTPSCLYESTAVSVIGWMEEACLALFLFYHVSHSHGWPVYGVKFLKMSLYDYYYQVLRVLVE